MDGENTKETTTTTTATLAPDLTANLKMEVAGMVMAMTTKASSEAPETVIDYDLMTLYRQNRSLHQPWFGIFISLYAILIILSTIGNVFLITSVCLGLRRRRSRPNSGQATEDLLILLLAVSDLLLCVTMPWTALDALTKFWPFGVGSGTLCQVVKSSSAATVYSSSLIIIAIAVDRYRRIVRSTGPQMSTRFIAVVAGLVCVTSVLVSSPIFYNTTLFVPDYAEDAHPRTSPSSPADDVTTTLATTLAAEVEAADEAPAGFTRPPDNSSLTSSSSSTAVPVAAPDDWSHVVFCIEDWKFPSQQLQSGGGRNGNSRMSAGGGGGGGGQELLQVGNRLYYSVFALVVQYVLPLTAISAAYGSIYVYLKRKRLIRKQNEERDREKAKRTNLMLLSISTIFCFCWLPLNLLNVVLDSHHHLFSSSTETMTIVFVLCHLVGMSSAFINPVIYGFWNERFRKEFTDLNDGVKRAILASLAPILFKPADNAAAAATVNAAEVAVAVAGDDVVGPAAHEQVRSRHPQDDPQNRDGDERAMMLAPVRGSGETLHEALLVRVSGPEGSPEEVGRRHDLQGVTTSCSGVPASVARSTTRLTSLVRCLSSRPSASGPDEEAPIQPLAHLMSSHPEVDAKPSKTFATKATNCPEVLTSEESEDPRSPVTTTYLVKSVLIGRSAESLPADCRAQLDDDCGRDYVKVEDKDYVEDEEDEDDVEDEDYSYECDCSGDGDTLDLKAVIIEYVKDGLVTANICK